MISETDRIISTVKEREEVKIKNLPLLFKEIDKALACLDTPTTIKDIIEKNFSDDVKEILLEMFE